MSSLLIRIRRCAPRHDSGTMYLTNSTSAAAAVRLTTAGIRIRTSADRSVEQPGANSPARPGANSPARPGSARLGLAWPGSADSVHAERRTRAVVRGACLGFAPLRAAGGEGEAKAKPFGRLDAHAGRIALRCIASHFARLGGAGCGPADIATRTKSGYQGLPGVRVLRRVTDHSRVRPEQLAACKPLGRVQPLVRAEPSRTNTMQRAAYNVQRAACDVQRAAAGASDAKPQLGTRSYSYCERVHANVRS